MSDEFIQRIRSDVGFLSKILSIIDNRAPLSDHIIEMVENYPFDGYVIGITGPSGAGKSTLIGKLAKLFLDEGEKVAVLAVDPSSPLSGGAILGDRLRMKELFLNKGAFIRSIGTRGGRGGINPSVSDMVKVINCAGFKNIFIETAGIGQGDVEIMNIADCVVLILTPDYGDDIQAMKSGILEVTDIFVLNKSDKSDADALLKELEEIGGMMEGEGRGRKKIVLKTSAKTGEGIQELKDALENYLNELKKGGRLEEIRYKKRVKELLNFLFYEFSEAFLEMIERGELPELKEMLMSGKSVVKIGNKIKEDSHGFKKMFLR